jgi:hypothetical protein
MNQTPTYSYDKEADVLYISFSPGEKATTAVELNDNILLRFNRAEKRAFVDRNSPRHSRREVAYLPRSLTLNSQRYCNCSTYPHLYTEDH